MNDLHEGFRKADSTASGEPPFQWLDKADQMPLIQEIKRRMLDLAPVRPGDRVLDVGCGVGHEVQRFAERVGSQGSSVGIDRNPAMIGEACRRAEGLLLPLRFAVDDAHHLAFPDGEFALCRAERVLRYVEDPARVVREMARMAHSGGSVVVFDFDADQSVVDVPDSRLARRVTDVLDAAIPQPWIGRQLFRLFHEAGLVDVRVLPYAFCLPGASGFALYEQLGRGSIEQALEAGTIAEDDVAAWWEWLRRTAQAGTFFAASLAFIAAGRKP